MTDEANETLNHLLKKEADEEERAKAEEFAAYQRHIAERAPYGEWCRKPAACFGKGYCPLDPTCGD